jgi:hypothetical protein
MRIRELPMHPQVLSLLELAGPDLRPMPLVAHGCREAAAASLLSARGAEAWFAGSRSSRGALAGLWLYFSALEPAHALAQAEHSAEGSYWHAIVHRQEPDAGNSAYWLRRVGRHPVFEQLAAEAAALAAAEPAAGFAPPAAWDPFVFLAFAETARRQADSAAGRLAQDIQLAEWRLLLLHSAAPAGGTRARMV